MRQYNWSLFKKITEKSGKFGLMGLKNSNNDKGLPVMESANELYKYQLDKDNHLPYYSQLKRIIIEAIEREELTAEEKLPPEKDLVEHFGVSRITVRKALDELEKEGYINKIQGKGSFVSHEIIKQDLLKFYSFTEEMEKEGRVPSSRVLDFKVAQVDDKIQAKLRSSPEEKMLIITRLRLADSTPMIVETSYLPQSLFPDITREEVNNNPLYDILKKKYDVTFTRAEEIFTSTSLTRQESEILKSSKNRPAILLERITYSENRIIEYTKSVVRGDKFKFRVVLQK